MDKGFHILHIFNKIIFIRNVVYSTLRKLGNKEEKKQEIIGRKSTDKLSALPGVFSSHIFPVVIILLYHEVCHH